jgi:hypothetical protein
MEQEIEEISVNGVTYVKKGENALTPAEKLDGLEYCIVRTYSAGVFAGYLKSRTGQEVVLLKARRLWYWDGAASLSQLSVDGVSKPQNCKFPCEVASVDLIQAIEILPCTEKARKSIAGVGIWKM